ncbi:hypothetical protein [Eikenella sp. Marseille-P7795]|uniref:hypothetical protein n=1 Tax=Eikenella sp. Marseille-P7795 TaxID=2866577 RepID=UPI001CE4A4ED|nr:hypothetical protein [Eikenella sp. Marseille-P7795]
MAVQSLTLWVLSLYITLFLTAAFQRQQFSWLWGSVLLWLGFGLISARIMPGVLGITHIANVYPVYGYIVLASLFLFANGWRYDARQMGWKLEGGGTFLAYFAVAGAVQHITLLFLLLIVIWQYPQGMSAPMLTGLLSLYFLQPVLWIAGQMLLMLLMWLHRRYLSREEVRFFSPLQLQGVLLLSLFFQVACLLAKEKMLLIAALRGLWMLFY